MLYIGDSVSHNDLPPFEGLIIGIQENVNGKSKIAVESEAGKILYDYEDCWDMISSGVDDSIGNLMSLGGSDREIIEVEYTVVRD